MRQNFRAGGQAGGLTVYVNGRGAAIRGGFEDAANNRSSIALSRGRDRVNVPAFSAGAQVWGSMMSCVREQLGDYDITVTDRRPESGEYIMMMVGGRPGMLGYQQGVGGVAPYTGSVVNGTVGFIFADAYGDDARELCETVAHEIGHTLGLDHTYECTDTMSYLHGCGEKTFQDKDMACGEWGARSCGSGQRVQNSHYRLAKLVGLRPQAPGQPTPPPPSAPPADEPPPVLADTHAPRISMLSPRNGSSFEYGDVLFIVFSAEDEGGIAKVELLWRAFGETSVFRCGELPEDLPIECGRAGDEFAFALQVGAGERNFAIRVTDTAGNSSTTRWRRASFAEPEVDVDVWAQVTDDYGYGDDDDDGYGDCG